MIHKENDYQIQVKKRGHQTRSVRMINRNARKFLGQGFMERNMALIGFVQLDTNNNFFLTQQVHKETWAGLAVKLRGSTNCAGVNSRVKHTRVRKHQHKHVI
jgi:hypothetical protein